MLRHPRSFMAACLAMVSIGPRAALADDAQVLFDEAMKQISGGAYDSACPKLEEVNRLAPGKIGARLELARCYEQWGKLGSAWRHYSIAADLAAAAKDKREAK